MDSHEPESETPLTVSEVARLVRLSEKAIRGVIARGELTAYRLAGQLRVYPADLRRWLAANVVVVPAVQPRRPRAPVAIDGGSGSLERLRAIERGAAR